MALKLIHNAPCICNSFGFTCEEFAKMHQDMITLHEVCVHDTECIQHAYNKGTTENQKAAYMYLMYSIVQRTIVRHHPSHEKKS